MLLPFRLFLFALCLTAVVACQQMPDKAQANDLQPAQKTALLPVLTDKPNDSLSMHTATFTTKDGLPIAARVYNKNKAFVGWRVYHKCIH